MDESGLPEVSRCLGELAATALRTQRELDAARAAAPPGLEAFAAPAMRLARLAVSMTVRVGQTRSAGGRIGLALGPLNAYVAGAYRREASMASRIEIVVEPVPAPPAKHERR